MTKNTTSDVLKTERRNFRKLIRWKTYKMECTTDVTPFSNSNTAITSKKLKPGFMSDFTLLLNHKASRKPDSNSQETSKMYNIYFAELQTSFILINQHGQG